MSWRLPPRSSRWRWMRPELASRGATPLWRASWASLWKRSIGPISASSLAAVTAPQPGSSSSAGRGLVGPLFELAVELGDRAVERAAAGDELAREPHLELSARGGRASGRRAPGGRRGRASAAARRRSGRAGAGASAAAAGFVGARRRGRRDGRQAASSPDSAARPAAAGSGPAPAAPHARSRARRSGRTSRASSRPDAQGRSASAAPAPSLRRRRAAAARASA